MKFGREITAAMQTLGMTGGVFEVRLDNFAGSDLDLFLYASDGSFYFLEVNARLQVEHGVTELVSGAEDYELAGLVTEVGSPISHGAVVAREYGLPAVMSVHDAMERLTEGAWVRIDGGAGTVTVL